MLKFAEESQNIMYDYQKLKSSFIEGYFNEKLENLHDMVEYLSNGVSYVEKSLNVDEIYDIINTKKELEISKNLLDSYRENEAVLLDKETNVKILKEEINELEVSYESYNKRLEEIKEEVNKNNKYLNASKTKLNILMKLKTSREQITEIENTITEKESFLANLEKASIEYDNLVKEYDEFCKSLQSNKRIKESLEKEYNKNEKDLNYIQILLDKKEELDEKFSYTKLIKNALDPKQGIPLLYIDDFLQSITEKTNKLLSIAYDDRFKISFDLTDKDFFIRVHRLFSELEDINQASQGETSMTTLSLSLSMIENMVKKYNILYLDEIDATLSTENRRLFLSMLEKQLTDLGIEQVFIISHNNEFYSYPVDLILFHEHGVDINDKEFMINKNIIFNVEDLD
jgi:DNA repair exonuclease SbcCD ATPase subunit